MISVLQGSRKASTRDLIKNAIPVLEGRRRGKDLILKKQNEQQLWLGKCIPVTPNKLFNNGKCQDCTNLINL